MAQAATAQQMTVREIKEGSAWEVDSPSGNTYTVRYRGSGDADPEYVALYDCTCPAYTFGRGGVCKHINAVVAWCDAREEAEAEEPWCSNPHQR